MASKTLKSRILSIVTRNRRGLTVSEINTKLQNEMSLEGFQWYSRPAQSSVRGRVYELAKSGQLSAAGARRSTETNTLSTIYTKPTATTGCGSY